MRMCGDLFSTKLRTRGGVSLSLSLSLSFFVKNLCFVWGRRLLLCSCRRVVVSKKRRYSRFPFLDFETLYDLLKKREREREEGI